MARRLWSLVLVLAIASLLLFVTPSTLSSVMAGWMVLSIAFEWVSSSSVSSSGDSDGDGQGGEGWSDWKWNLLLNLIGIGVVTWLLIDDRVPSVRKDEDNKKWWRIALLLLGGLVLMVELFLSFASVSNDSKTSSSESIDSLRVNVFKKTEEEGIGYATIFASGPIRLRTQPSCGEQADRFAYQPRSDGLVYVWIQPNERVKVLERGIANADVRLRSYRTQPPHAFFARVLTVEGREGYVNEVFLEEVGNLGRSVQLRSAVPQRSKKSVRFSSVGK